MKNEEIILINSIELMKKGILDCASTIKVANEEGVEEDFDYPEEIHTYKEWQKLGYKVKKGEHAIAKFPIWYPSKQKKQNDSEDESENEKPKVRLYMRNASWFKSSQVEKIEEGK